MNMPAANFREIKMTFDTIEILTAAFLREVDMILLVTR